MNKKRVCNNCKKSMLTGCEALKNNEEYLKIIKEDDSIFNEKLFDFKDNYTCDEFKSMYIEYPIEVSKINSDNEIFTLAKNKVGKFAKIRPCSEEYKNKTFLGLYLGDLPIGNNISHNPDTKELKVSFHCNPAIFVFDLNKIIYGCESWWGVIKSEEDLNSISDCDIDNVWYVRALKTLQRDSQYVESVK